MQPFQFGVISTTVCVLNGINRPLMILIGRWHMVPHLRLLLVLLTATGVLVSYTYFFIKFLLNNIK